MKIGDLAQELQRIALKHQGQLLPSDIVEAARPKSSPLHSRFEWDDGEAAEQYRLWQARQLIRVLVTVEKNGSKSYRVRLYTSLGTDRKSGGGYRLLRVVLRSKRLRGELLKDALRDMRVFEEKYRGLKELSDVFEAMHDVAGE
jgi:hypothetical protein